MSVGIVGFEHRSREHHCVNASIVATVGARNARYSGFGQDPQRQQEPARDTHPRVWEKAAIDVVCGSLRARVHVEWGHIQRVVGVSRCW